MIDLEKEKKAGRLSLLSLFIVIFLDVAGVILVLPILTPLILKTDSSLVPLHTSIFYRDFLYGFALALYPLFMFFSTPILGDLSDKFGRKKILLLCAGGSALSYVVSALGILYGSLTTFLLGRVLGGLAAGTQPIATAAIIDVSDYHSKTKNLAWVVFTTSLGLILGPTIGGVTAETQVSGWFGYETPFFLAAIVNVLNALFLLFSYQEQPFVKRDHVLRLTKGFSLFVSAFSERRFCLLSSLYFCFVLAWSLYYQTINWFFMARFHYNTAQLGFFVTFIGVVFAVMSSIVARFILKWFSHETSAFAFFIFTMGIANIGAALSHGELAQWLWAILNASSDVICLTISLSVYSSLANHESQGWIMGVTGAIGSLTWSIGALLSGPLGYINIHAPMWAAGVLCFISFTLMSLYRREVNMVPVAAAG